MFGEEFILGCANFFAYFDQTRRISLIFTKKNLYKKIFI